MEKLPEWFQPLGLLIISIFLAVVIILIRIVQASDRKDRTFAISGLFLIACLDSLAYLTGFSIGGIISIATIPFGVALGLISGYYRFEIAFATLISVLMVLSTVVHLPWAGAAYKVMPYLLAIVSTIGIMRNWKNPQKALGFGLGFTASLIYLAFVTEPPASAWIGLTAVGLGCSLGIFYKLYRAEFLFLVWGGVLWVLNLISS